MKASEIPAGPTVAMEGSVAHSFGTQYTSGNVSVAGIKIFGPLHGRRRRASRILWRTVVTQYRCVYVSTSSHVVGSPFHSSITTCSHAFCTLTARALHRAWMAISCRSKDLSMSIFARLIVTDTWHGDAESEIGVCCAC